MLTQATRKRVVSAIYSEPELYGCRIGYYGDNACSSLSDGFVPSVNYSRVIIIVEEASTDGVSIDAELTTSTPTVVPALPEPVKNGSKIVPELIGAGLSCGFAVVSGVAMIGGAAAEVPTLGASTVLVVAGWVGFATSAIQCVNGVVRTYEVVANPESSSLEEWDKPGLYSGVMLVVDGIGVLTAVASLPSAAKNLLAILERRGGLVTAQQLANMTKAERQAATKAAIDQATRTPDGAKEVAKALKDAGLTPKQVAQAAAHGAGTVRRSKTAIKAITEVTSARLNTQILGALSGGLSPIASGLPSSLVGSASGSVNAVIVHVMNLGQQS